MVIRIYTEEEEDMVEESETAAVRLLSRSETPLVLSISRLRGTRVTGQDRTTGTQKREDEDPGERDGTRGGVGGPEV